MKDISGSIAEFFVTGWKFCLESYPKKLRAELTHVKPAVLMQSKL